MKFFSVAWIILVLLVSACGSGGGSGDTTPVAVEQNEQQPGSLTSEQSGVVDPGPSPSNGQSGQSGVDEPTELQRELEWLHGKMKSEYLWYDETPDLDYLTYASAEELLDVMKVHEKDKFSYITSAKRNAATQTATSVTYGMRVSTGDTIRVKRVYRGGSAKAAGVERADVISRIGDVTVTDEASADAAWDLTRDKTAGSTLEFEFARENLDEPFIAVLEAVEVSRETVDYAAVTTDANGNGVGYIYIFEFRTRNDKTDDELRSAFEFFAERNVQTLIIDLRDNRGGSIKSVNTLGSLILGNEPAGSEFIDFRFSDLGEVIFENEGFTTGYSLNAEEYALAIERVHIITSHRTCSASEILINSLRGYVDVQVSGVTTCGKPYGFYSRYFEEKSVLFAINFQSDNVLDEGGWVNGLDATCVLPDFQIYPFGDNRDPHISSALGYLDTGACAAPVVVADTLARTRGQGREVYHPAWSPEFSPDR